jgi:hypothetical protein
VIFKLLFLLTVLFPFLLGGFVLWAVLRWFNGPIAKRKKKEDKVPETVRTIAFVVLVILLFGVTSGFLGAA